MKTLYVHIPFCEKKCFYCSFVISVGQIHCADQYLDCLDREARQYDRSEVQSVFIGGGTPTLMNNSQLKRLFDIIRKYFRVSREAEWTIESNPEGLELSKLELLKRKGITRISLGIQSLNDNYLKYLGRNHDAPTAIKTFFRLREAGFDNINVDLMFAFQDQTIEELKNDVDAVTRLGSEHLSLYTLTIEEHSRFFARNVRLPEGDDQARQYTLVCEMLHAAGFEQYEISNFAKINKTSRHNMNYWQGGEYIGLGVGAHSYINAKRSWNVSRLKDYISGVQGGVSVEEGFEELTPLDQLKEVVLFGLRMNQGVDIGQIQKQFDCFLSDRQQKKVDDFIRAGFLVREKDHLKTSSKGRLVLDELCAQLI